LADRQPNDNLNQTLFQMVALLPEVWCFGEAERMRDEKTTSESKHPFSFIQHGKIELEAYGKEMTERGSRQPRPPLGASMISRKG
jgi:hypothetical protein